MDPGVCVPPGISGRMAALKLDGCLNPRGRPPGESCSTAAKVRAFPSLALSFPGARPGEGGPGPGLFLLIRVSARKNGRRNRFHRSHACRLQPRLFFAPRSRIPFSPGYCHTRRSTWTWASICCSSSRPPFWVRLASGQHPKTPGVWGLSGWRRKGLKALGHTPSSNKGSDPKADHACTCLEQDVAGRRQNRPPRRSCNFRTNGSLSVFFPQTTSNLELEFEFLFLR